MQINKDEIQRSTLITPFLSEELTPDNEFLTYVDTNNDCKSVTQTTNNSKKQHKKNFKPHSHNYM